MPPRVGSLYRKSGLDPTASAAFDFSSDASGSRLRTAACMNSSRRAASGSSSAEAGANDATSSARATRKADRMRPTGTETTTVLRTRVGRATPMSGDAGLTS